MTILPRKTRKVSLSIAWIALIAALAISGAPAENIFCGGTLFGVACLALYWTGV